MITIIVLWILLGLIAVIVILLHFSVTAEIRGGTDTDFSIRLKYMFFTIYPRTPEKNSTGTTCLSEKSDVDFDGFDDLYDDGITFDEETDKSVENEKNDMETQEGKADEGLSDSVKTDIKYEDFFDDTQQSEETCEDEKIHTVNEKKAVESKEHIRRKKSEKGKNKTAGKTKRSKGKLEKIKEQYNKLKPYIPVGWKYFKKLLKTIRFTDTKIQIITGKEDACESALFYGKIQGALFNLIGVLSGIFTVKLKEVNVNCVFNEKTFKANGKTTVKVRPSAVISITFCIAVNFLRIFLPDYLRKRKQKKKKQKCSDKRRVSENGGQTA